MKVKALYNIQHENTYETEKIKVTWDGFERSKHSSRTMIAPGYITKENGTKKGDEILNYRQITIVSHEELSVIAQKLGLDVIDPIDFRPSIVVEGHENFTKIPLGTRLVFPNGCILYITDENSPCVVTAQRVQDSNPQNKTVLSRLAKESMGLRGVHAIVLKPGLIYKNDEIELKNSMRSLIDKIVNK